MLAAWLDSLATPAALTASVDAETARARLTEAGGAVRQALGEPADVVG